MIVALFDIILNMLNRIGIVEPACVISPFGRTRLISYPLFNSINCDPVDLDAEKISKGDF